MNARLLSLALLCVSLTANAAQFNIVITNSATSGPAWSTGLLTLTPPIALGLSPRPDAGAGAFYTYTFANSQCDFDAGCTGNCDNGNAALLATRLGRTVGVNAWIIPSLALGATYPITIDAPVGSTLSYIAWLADVSVFDDFVAMHPPGIANQLWVPLFNGSTPVDSVDFVISGYDMNSVSPTDGSGGTCAPACPTAATGCYIAPGNASYGPDGGLPIPTVTPPVRNFTGVAGNTTVRLAWSHTAPHTGTLILRHAGSAVSVTPTNGVSYDGGTIGNGGNQSQVIYVGPATAFTDQGLMNGTRYFYKAFAYANNFRYASGSVPGTNGLFVEPTIQTGASPLYCSSVGFAMLGQPTNEQNLRVYSGSNGGTLTANNTAPGTQDGWEAWRPAQFAGAMQVRPTVVPLFGRSGNWIIAADQAGFGYLVNAATGAIAWTTPKLGDAIQGQPVTQLYNYATPGGPFQMNHPNRDLVFYATRNVSNTNNKVYAISSVNGSIVWTSSGTGNLDYISGGMAVDYVNNRVWVAARSNMGTQNSLRVLNSITGAQVASFNLGDIDNGVNLRFLSPSNEAVVITNNATVYAFDVATMTQKWTRSLGSTNATAWTTPINTGFIASVTNSVQRWNVFPDAGSALMWSANVPGVAGITIDYNRQTVLAGGTSNRLRTIDIADGGTIKALQMPSAATVTFGQPALDVAASRLHVGTADGRLCAFPVPFP